MFPFGSLSDDVPPLHLDRSKGDRTHRQKSMFCGLVTVTRKVISGNGCQDILIHECNMVRLCMHLGIVMSIGTHILIAIEGVSVLPLILIVLIHGGRCKA